MKDTTKKRPRAVDALTAARIRNILADPTVRRRDRQRLDRLVAEFYVGVGNGRLDDTPDLAANYYTAAAADLPASEPNPEARELRERVIALAEELEPEEYKVAPRCAEIYEAERGRAGEGAYFFMEHVDAVTQGARQPDGRKSERRVVHAHLHEGRARRGQRRRGLRRTQELDRAR